MPGPLPKMNPSRRNYGVGPQELPAEGRTGDPPQWPLDDPGETETDTWAELWHTPQAVVWERLGWNRIVARYCRMLTEAEHPTTSPVAFLAETRQMEDRLGLTPMSMRKLDWRIVVDELGARRETEAPSTVRARLRAVEDTG